MGFKTGGFDADIGSKLRARGLDQNWWMTSCRAGGHQSKRIDAGNT